MATRFQNFIPAMTNNPMAVGDNDPTDPVKNFWCKKKKVVLDGLKSIALIEFKNRMPHEFAN